MSSVGNMGGNFLPPAPSPRSLRAPSPLFGEEKSSTWVSPLDVHFSRPGTPVRPASFLPKLQFPLEFGKSDLTIPLPDFNKPKSETTPAFEPVIVKPPPTAGGRAKTPKEIYAEFSQQGFAKSPTLSNFSQQSFAESPTLSTFSKQEPLMKSPTFSTFSKEEPSKAKPPTFSVFPQQAQQAPPRPNRLSMKSMFSTEELPVRSPKEDFSRTFQLPPVPLDDLAPMIPPVNPDRFPKDLNVWNPASPIRDSIVNRQRQPTSAGARHSHEWTLPSPTLPDEMIDAEWQPSEKAIIRASVVSKQRVSVIRGPGAQSQDLDVQFARMRSRGHSMAASSMYSTRTSILEPGEQSKRHTRTRSQSSEARARASTRDFSNSSHKRVSSRSLSRTRDSLRGSRKTSNDSFKSADSHRRSRERDQLHFDPTSHRRNRSGSVQGRSVDFDQPRESPFSNSNGTSSHSATSSVSSSQSSDAASPPKPILNHHNQANSGAPLQPRMPFVQDPDRLSIAPQIHGRSASEVSQNSIGDFYDSYYRQSTMGRNSGMPNPPLPPASRNSVQDRAQAFEDKSRGRSGSIGAPKRPAPLKIGNGNNNGAGSGYGGFNTIVEVATPMPSPLVMGDAGRERFPTMI